MSQTLSFHKMNGAGNDFVVVDNRDRKLSFSKEQIAQLCHRQFGIGADGLLAVESDDQGADFRMRYYNADGGEAEMCGNGARCFARYVHRFLPSGTKGVSFRTPAGLIQAIYDGDEVSIELTPPRDQKLNQKVPLTSGEQTIHSLNTGVPHAVVFVPDAEQVPVLEWGREIRYHAAFAPKGTNVNFVQILGKDRIRVRTYERGVEGETLACGTGVVASALLANLAQGIAVPTQVQVQSGDILRVGFSGEAGQWKKVTLQGPAVIVFEGTAHL